MKLAFRISLGMALLLVAIVGAQAQASSVEVGGFVTQSQGEITFISAGGEKQELPAFARLVSGTQITMGDNAKLQIIFLGSGHQELWSGKGEIIVGDQESRAVSQSADPVIRMLPPYMVEALVRSGEVMTNIHARQGMVRVRALHSGARIREAEGRYAELRAQATEDDIAPEIYLLTTLEGLKAYRSMVNPLEEMLRRQPDNFEARVLYDHFMLLLGMGAIEGSTSATEEPK